MKNEIFGYYLNTKIVEKYGCMQETDYTSFHFNLQSNGRLSHPMKFEIKNLKHGGIIFFDKTWGNLIDLGDISLYKENIKNNHSDICGTNSISNTRLCKFALIVRLDSCKH